MKSTRDLHTSTAVLVIPLPGIALVRGVETPQVFLPTGEPRVEHNRGAQLIQQKAKDNKQARERERDGFTSNGFPKNPKK